MEINSSVMILRNGIRHRQFVHVLHAICWVVCVCVCVVWDRKARLVVLAVQEGAAWHLS